MGSSRLKLNKFLNKNKNKSIEIRIYDVLTQLGYENSSLAGERERENRGLFLQYVIQNDNGQGHHQ